MTVLEQRRECDWCWRTIPAGARSDATVCRKECRQQKSRARRRAAELGITLDELRRRRAFQEAAATPGWPECAFCEQPILAEKVRPARKRSDAGYCSKKCRQDSWRFGERGPDRHFEPGSARRFGYADPPYPGMSKRYYETHPAYAGEVDHLELVERLVADYPDGWVLHTSSKTLRRVLPIYPPGVRLGSWVKPVPPHNQGTVFARDAWEPVIFCGGRPRPPEAPHLLNWCYAPVIRWDAYPGGVIGMKPPELAWWMFDSLGAQAGDELEDLYPGSGAVSRAWGRYQAVAREEAPAELLVPLRYSSEEIAAAGRRRRRTSIEKTSSAAVVLGDASEHVARTRSGVARRGRVARRVSRRRPARHRG